MRIDWLVAAVTFLMFLSWAFSYYNYSLYYSGLERTQSALRAADAIYSYMGADTAMTPANITFSYDAPGTVVQARMNWTDGFVNSTRVVLSPGSAEPLGCMISGDTLYFEADLSAGDNTFYIEQGELDVPMNCTAILSGTPGNQTMLLSSEPGRALSSGSISQACSFMDSGYQEAKGVIASGYDFRVEVSSGGTPYYCGFPEIPAGREVFSFPFSGRLWEGGTANITVSLWR